MTYIWDNDRWSNCVVTEGLAAWTRDDQPLKLEHSPGACSGLCAASLLGNFTPQKGSTNPLQVCSQVAPHTYSVFSDMMSRRTLDLIRLHSASMGWILHAAGPRRDICTLDSCVTHLHNCVYTPVVLTSLPQLRRVRRTGHTAELRHREVCSRSCYISLRVHVSQGPPT